MKKIIETKEVESEHLASLLGQSVTFFCMNYIYTGILTEVATDTCKLFQPAIVYETGPFGEPAWKDAQRLPKDNLFIYLNTIESFMELK